MPANKQIADIMQLIVTNLSHQATGHQIHSRIFASQGLAKLAEKYAEHAEEERGFVTRFIDRLLDLGCEVRLEANEAGPVITDPIEYIKYDLSVSRDEAGKAAMRDLIALAAKEDYQSFEVLRDYYVDEDEDAAWFEMQLGLAERIGEQNWLAAQM